MFLKLAAGNIIKNGRTSITILAVIFVCVYFMQFGVSFTDGFRAKLTGDYLDDAGHVNIYDRTFYKEMDFGMNEYNVELTPKLIRDIKSIPGVVSVKPELNFGALVNSDTKDLECVVQAIEPDGAGDNYAKLAASVIEGKFISGGRDIMLGRRCAQLLAVKPGDKIILLTMDQYGSINAVEGTVTGIFRTFSAQLDERGIICCLPLAQKLLAIDNSATKIKVNLKDPFASEAAAKQLNAMLPANAEAVPWQTEQKFVTSYLKIMNVAAYFISFIIILGASLGIINSFLMSIMNRLPEFGALRAIGLGKLQMLMMIGTESLLLGIVGTAAALIPGTMTVLYFQAHPFNYEKMFRTMQGSAVGAMDATMGTVFVPATFVIIVLTGILISVLASAYPALIAVSKKPSDIMRVLE